MTLIAKDFPIGYIPEVTITFNNGDQYIIRPNGIGDTVIGEFAHKIMWALVDKEKGNNSSSVYRFSMNDKIKFILQNSETLCD